MNRTSSCKLSGMLQFVFAAVLLGLPLANPSAARAQDVVVSGLLRPAKLIQTPLGNLLVAEVGTAVNNSSRISIVDEDGNRRTLIDGLPSAINAVNTPTGASGLYLHGRTLYVTVGEGDVTKPGPIPRTEVANPTPASPVFSSVLAVHFSAAAEQRTTGVTLNLADHHALKAGQKLVRSDASGQKITIELVADFPDYTPEPLPALAANVRHSHPYGVVADDDFLYVVDAGPNSVRRVEIESGLYDDLVRFPLTPNPGPVGPRVIENVPTSVHWDGDRLVVTLLSGFPFIAGLSQVHRVDRETGEDTPLIQGLASAIDVIHLPGDGGPAGFLTLEYSLAHLAGGPGRLQLFDEAINPVAVISNTLVTPSSVIFDRRTGSIIVAELNTNRLISFHLP